MQTCPFREPQYTGGELTTHNSQPTSEAPKVKSQNSKTLQRLNLNFSSLVDLSFHGDAHFATWGAAHARQTGDVSFPIPLLSTLRAPLWRGAEVIPAVLAQPQHPTPIETPMPSDAPSEWRDNRAYRNPRRDAHYQPLPRVKTAPK